MLPSKPSTSVNRATTAFIQLIHRGIALLVFPVGLQPTDLDPWGRPGPICAIGTGRSLSSGRPAAGPGGRCGRIFDVTIGPP